MIDGWMDEWIDGWMNEWIDGWMGFMDGRDGTEWMNKRKKDERIKG